MNNKMSDYKIVRSDYVEGLEEQVIQLLSDGWLLAGGVHCVVYKKIDHGMEWEDPEFMQAVYKEGL